MIINISRIIISFCLSFSLSGCLLYQGDWFLPEEDGNWHKGGYFASDFLCSIYEKNNMWVSVRSSGNRKNGFVVTVLSRYNETIVGFYPENIEFSCGSEGNLHNISTEILQRLDTPPEGKHRLAGADISVKGDINMINQCRISFRGVFPAPIEVPDLRVRKEYIDIRR